MVRNSLKLEGLGRCGSEAETSFLYCFLFHPLESSLALAIRVIHIRGNESHTKICSVEDEKFLVGV